MGLETRPLTAAATQRILAIADDPTTLKRLADAIQAGGASPVLVRGPSMLDQTPGPLPFRFIMYAWDGNAEGMATVTARMREAAQLVGIVPPSNLAAFTRLLADPRCNHVLTADDAGFQMVTVTTQ